MTLGIRSNWQLRKPFLNGDICWKVLSILWPFSLIIKIWNSFILPRDCLLDKHVGHSSFPGLTLLPLIDLGQGRVSRCLITNVVWASPGKGLWIHSPASKELSFLFLLKERYENDSLLNNPPMDILLEYKNSFWTWAHRLYVPEVAQVEVLKLAHDSKLARHFGVSKTEELLSCSFWWPGYKKDVKGFVACVSVHAIRHPELILWDCSSHSLSHQDHRDQSLRTLWSNYPPLKKWPLSWLYRPLH